MDWFTSTNELHERVYAPYGRGARSRRPWEAAAVLIRLWIQGSQPLAGTAATEGGEPLPFEGWLEMLRVVSELVAAAPSSDEDADAAG
jgi:hypothetical protein